MKARVKGLTEGVRLGRTEIPHFPFLLRWHLMVVSSPLVVRSLEDVARSATLAQRLRPTSTFHGQQSPKCCVCPALLCEVAMSPATAVSLTSKGAKTEAVESGLY